MQANRFNKHSRPLWELTRTFVLPIVAIAGTVFLFGMALAQVDSRTRAENLRSSQAALSRTVTSCYAIEGRYPPNVAYMREHYGLAIDESAYIIHYNCFASNIAPEMWVQERYF